MNYDLLIFDLDGTLIDSQGDVGHALNRVLGDHGVAPLSAEVIRAHVGYGIQPLLTGELTRAGIKDLQPALNRFIEYYLGRCTTDTTLYPGVTHLLGQLADFTKVILTNKSTKFIEPILKRFDLTDHFQGWYGRESFATTKPDSLPLRSILSRHGGPASRALMIGDTETDVNAGQNAGVATCLFTGGYGTPAVLRSLRPTHRIEQMADLRDIVWPSPRR